MPTRPSPRNSLLRAACLLAVAASLSGPAGAAAGSVLVFERDILFDLATTQGVDIVIVRDDSFKNLVTEVTVSVGCKGLHGVLNVHANAPPPIPPKTLTTEFWCWGPAETIVIGDPVLPVYQGEDLPMVLDFAGVGEAIVHVAIYADRWS